MLKLLTLIYFLTLSIQALSNEPAKVLKIYHDSDYSNHHSSAHSMMMGMETALSEINHTIQGYKVELIKKDHRGNVKRSKMHMDQFLNDPNALFMLGGLHSPPYIKFRQHINESKILLIVPWAAGGPITRYPDSTNWVFRVSIDDTKVGFRIAEYALNRKNCNKPHLLLEDTPWGKSNYKNMSAAITNDGHNPPLVSWFNWNTQTNVARGILREIIDTQSDCILFVGNAIEGAEFAKGMNAMPSNSRIPIISHWGITGGNFHNVVTPDIRSGIDLSFIQSCFSFLKNDLDDFSQNVLNQAISKFPNNLQQAEDLQAPPGFYHAYDSGKIVIAALKEIQLSGNIEHDRALLRDQLENLTNPIQGLVKTYKQPFSSWSKENPDAHEALELNDICIAQFDKNNLIRVIEN